MIKKFMEKHPKIKEDCFLAETSVILGDVSLAREANIWYNAVLRGDLEPIQIGQRTNVQDLVMIHTSDGYPAIIGNDVTIGHSAIIHGAHISDRVLVGMGSILLDGVKVGSDVIIGAGSLLPPGKEYPSGVMILGRPAKVVRLLTQEEIQKIKASAEKYVNHSKKYIK